MLFQPLPLEIRRLATGALIFLVAFVGWASMQPGLAPPSHYGLDKVIHIGAFAVLSALATAAAPSRRIALGVFVSLIALGIGSEIAQSFIPGRTGSLLDLASDVGGLVFGVCGVYAVSRLARGHSEAGVQIS
jgi:VanZ family protein